MKNHGQITQEYIRSRQIRLLASRQQGALTRLSVILGIFPVLCLLLAPTTKIVEAAAPYVLVGGWILGAFFLYLMGQLVLNQVCPWKKLLITAEFNGILPIEARPKAGLRRVVWIREEYAFPAVLLVFMMGGKTSQALTSCRTTL